ncbi:MAG: hypothetical protein M1819_002836 [Sarea resinae]|nr:MAG: hypothetical protein M1819_002836 [Sarea resinae]
MSSFFGRFKPNTNHTNATVGSSTVRKDGPQPTPLERLLVDAGPLRNDGSDKFWGLENFGNTCYCNSILQCLYYSVPFREQVINYPMRSPAEILEQSRSGAPSVSNETSSSAEGTAVGASQAKRGTGSAGVPARKSVQNPGTTGTAGNRPDDNKEYARESPEWKKKQALATGPVLSMDYENAWRYGMSESLFTCLKDIFEAIIAHESRIGVVSPHKFLEILRNQNDMFRTAMHQDAHEFLNIVLNEVVANVEAKSKDSEAEKQRKLMEQDDLSTEQPPSASADSVANEPRTPLSNPGWVHELFEGTLTSETKCLTCENVSQRDEAFLDLSVDLEQHSSVTSCLRKFSQEEMLCERNKFHCDKCGGLQEAEKRMKIKRLPRILALHLKRFKYTEDFGRLQKLFHRVVYPYHLRLFNTTDDAEDPDRLYELYAVVVHIGGGPYHGHYISIIKTQDRGWLLFDDEMVEPVDKSYVRNFFGDKPGLACAYVLFYRETTLEDVLREQEAEGLAAAHAAQMAKEGVFTETKSNGVSVNGSLHHVHTVSGPLPEEKDKFISLDHAATAPTQTDSGAPSRPTKPAGPIPSASLPGHYPKTSKIPSRKERAREEKDRKAAEKERDRQEKQKVKDHAMKRKLDDKKHQEDFRAAISASKQTKVEEDSKTAKENGSQDKELGSASGTASGGKNRLRQSSKSISRKSQLWNIKDRDDSVDLKDVGVHADLSAGADETDQPRALPEATERHDRPKTHRFSLRKKPSSMFF